MLGGCSEACTCSGGEQLGANAAALDDELPCPVTASSTRTRFIPLWKVSPSPASLSVPSLETDASESWPEARRGSSAGRRRLLTFGRAGLRCPPPDDSDTDSDSNAMPSRPSSAGASHTAHAGRLAWGRLHHRKREGLILEISGPTGLQVEELIKFAR